MSKLLNNNRYRLSLIAAAIILLVGSIVLGITVPSLKVIELIPIAMLCGIGFTSFFKSILKIRNIITFLGMSVFLGLFLNTFVIFLLGTTGIMLTPMFFIIYLVIVSIVNIVLFLKFTPEEEVRNYIKNIKLDIVDVIAIAIFWGLFFMFASRALESYFFPWDVFTYWGVDAKYIFNNSSLRDGSFLALADNYLPFFTLQVDYVYLLYGRVVEQYATMLSLIYGYTAVVIVIGYILEVRKSILKKMLLYLGVFSAIYAFFTVQRLLISMYSDVFLGVVVLLYCIILFNREYKKEHYYQRFFLLVLLSLTLYLTKTHFFLFSILLLGALVIFDFKELKNRIFRKVKDWKFIISVALLLLVAFMVIRYIGILDHGGEMGFIESSLNKIVLGKELLVNLKNVVKGFLQHIPLVTAITSVFLIVAFVAKKGFSKDDLIKLGFLFLFVLPILAVYVLGIYPLGDGSIYRYLGMIYFVIPLFFIDIFPDFEIESRWQKMGVILIGMLGTLLLVTQIAFNTYFDFKYTPVDGAYVNAGEMWEYVGVSSGVESLVPKDATVMVLSYQFEVENLTDFLEPGNHIRYFLLDYIDNRPYACLSYDCLPYFQSVNPDYLVIYNYEDYWQECSDIFEEKSSYLVKFQFDKETFSTGKCFVKAEDVTKLL